MAIWAKIKRLKLTQLMALMKVFIKRPRLILPTYRATQQTLHACNQHFGKAHHKNNTSNAFRHALWNIILADYAFAVTHDQTKALDWAKQITDLHEKLAPNPALAQAMDLHNNAVGRSLFKQGVTKKTAVKVLLQLMDNAQRISSPEEAKSQPKNLVYLEPSNNN